MTPDLRSYDIILVNSSAGKDSQAMLDYVHSRALMAGVADRIIVFHADLGRVEWPGVAELSEEHAEHYGVRFTKLSRRQGDLLDHVAVRGMWPDAARRYCTSDHKRGQGYRMMTALVAERYEGEPVRILNCMGFRKQESPARKRKVEFREDRRASNGKRTVHEWCPILEWGVDQVWARIAQAGTRYHWAYDLGMPRLSCVFCVLASRSALILAAQHMPNLAKQYRTVEIATGHDFKQGLSMAQIIKAAKSEVVQAAQDWAA